MRLAELTQEETQKRLQDGSAYLDIVVKGEWLTCEYGGVWVCSECGTWKSDDSAFCPDCGADMRGESK